MYLYTLQMCRLYLLTDHYGIIEPQTCYHVDAETCPCARSVGTGTVFLIQLSVALLLLFSLISVTLLIFPSLFAD